MPPTAIAAAISFGTANNGANINTAAKTCLITLTVLFASKSETLP